MHKIDFLSKTIAAFLLNGEAKSFFIKTASYIITVLLEKIVWVVVLFYYKLTLGVILWRTILMQLLKTFRLKAILFLAKGTAKGISTKPTF